MDFLSEISPILEVLSIAVFGIFAVAAIFGKGFRQVKDESDRADDRLINLLRSTVDTLDRKVKVLEEEQSKTRLELTRLRTENETMSKILQGRDTSTVEYQKASYESMKLLAETYKVSQETNANVEKLYRLLDEHFKSIK